MRSKLKFVPLLFVYVLFMSACSSLAIESPKTFNERLAFAYAQADGIVKTTNAALTADAITVEDATYVRDTVRSARDHASLAEQALIAGDWETAEGRLQLATGILRALNERVRPKSIGGEK